MKVELRKISSEVIEESMDTEGNTPWTCIGPIDCDDCAAKQYYPRPGCEQTLKAICNDDAYSDKDDVPGWGTDSDN